MPILPRADIPQGVPLPPRYATAPADTTIPAIMENVRQAGLAVTQGASTLSAARSRVSNATEMAKRTMMVETDLATLQDDIRSNRDLHKNAVDQYDEAVKGLSTKWTKGLSGELEAVLNERAARKVIAGRREMNVVQNKYLVDDAKNTTDNYERVKIDRAGRLDLTDEQVFDGVAPGRQEIFVTEKPSSVAVPSEYRQGLDAYVSSGAMTADAAGDRERNLLDAMAYRRIQRMSISDNPAVVQQALDLLDKDESEPGSNFARFLKVEHKNSLRAAAQGQKEKIEQKAISDTDRATRLYNDERKRNEEDRKRADNVATTDLVKGILDGNKGMADLNAMLITNDTLAQDRVAVEHIQDLITKRQQSGGATNWNLYNAFRREILQSRGAAQITERLLPVLGNGIAWEDGQKLLLFAKEQGENSIFKDDFYQGGQRAIDRMLEPKLGVADIGGEKARRHAEASNEFFLRAQDLVKKGEREKLPVVAKEIADRYTKQAPKVSVDKRWTPMYPDVESLVNGFISGYGLPEKWAPNVTDEFNRQARMLKDLEPPAEAEPTKPGPRPAAAPKPQPKTPDVVGGGS